VCVVQAVPGQLRKAALIAIVGLCVAINVETYADFFRDWNKQKELISVLAGNERIRQARLVVFDDRTSNARGRSFRFHEWNGLMKAAYGDEVRFGLNPAEVAAYWRGEYAPFFRARYGSKDHVPAVLEQCDTAIRVTRWRALCGITRMARPNGMVPTETPEHFSMTRTSPRKIPSVGTLRSYNKPRSLG
jgi:hypothetical protein